MADWTKTATDVFNRLSGYTYSEVTPDINHETIIVDTQAPDARSENYMTLDKFNSVEYDSVHLWECQISGAPSPFDKWFPAASCNEPTKGASVSTQSFGLEEVNVLSTYNALSMRVEFIDDDKATLENWISNWQEDCAVDNFYGFRYPEEVLHELYITKYTWQKEKVYTHCYLVLPTGTIDLNHNNDPSVKTLTVNFAVFGKSKT